MTSDRATPLDAEAPALLLGLIGAGIQRSLTPAMQRREGNHHGLRIHYQLIDLELHALGVEHLPELLRAVRWMNFAGVNITFPCKQAVLPLLDDLSPLARTMGAVNTVVQQGGRWIGHNTDGPGWAWAFRQALPRADLSSVALVGAGGAGSAIAFMLPAMGVDELRIFDSDAAKAHLLAEQLRQHHPNLTCRVADSTGQALRAVSGVIHATPSGMDKMPGLPFDTQLLSHRPWVSEVVYFPIETELLRHARRMGCAVLDGGGMAVGQAAEAFRLFTGQVADAQRMRQHFLQLLAKQG